MTEQANVPQANVPQTNVPQANVPQTDEPGTDEPGTDGARRSQAWFGAEGRMGMVYRSWMRNQGFGPRSSMVAR